jgi:hypothetical protein
MKEQPKQLPELTAAELETISGGHGWHAVHHPGPNHPRPAKHSG